MSEIVRVLRLLEYVGPREWIEHTFRNNGVKGEYVGFSRKGPDQGFMIREAILGQFPEHFDIRQLSNPETYKSLYPDDK